MFPLQNKKTLNISQTYFMSENDYSLQCEKVQRLEESLQKVVTQFNRIILRKIVL